MSGIFSRFVFNNEIFNTGDEVAPEVVVSAIAPAGISRRRRRYIMPDGTMLEATTQEAFEWLRLYSTPRPVAKAAPPRAAAIRMPAVVLEKRDVRFIPATDSSPDTWQAVISERFAFRAPPEIHRQAEIRANRMRADEEAAALMLCH